MKKQWKSIVLVGIGVSLLLATFISPFASSSPDGLEKVAENHGFLTKSEAPGVAVWEHAPIKDYAMPGVKSEGAATGIAGFVGALGTFFLAYGFALIVRGRKSGAA
jgi:cobalt/nickel transport protein